MATNEPLRSNASIARSCVVRDGIFLSCLNAPNRPDKTRAPKATPGTMCHQRRSSQGSAASSAPCAQGARVSAKVAPVPWTEMAVPRRSGNLEASVAAAVGCHSAVPKPRSTLAAKATPKAPPLPKSI